MRVFTLGMAPCTIALGAAAQSAAASPTPSAGTAGDDLVELSKKTQNPVSDLTSIPLQSNFYTGGDLRDRSVLQLNVQPVIPLRVVSNWNLIVRTIVPYLDLPLAAESEDDVEPDRARGLGDIQQQIFLTPTGGAFVWGVGPVLSYPVATNDFVRTGDWAVGPAGVVVFTLGPWLVGALASQLWTFAGDDRGENLNSFSVQPFVNYNLPDGWALTCAPLITANWAAEDDETWSIPLGAGVSKVVPIGEQLTTLSLQYYHLVDYSAPLGSEQLRLVANFMFPNAPSR